MIEQKDPMIESKLPNVGTTIFTVMSSLAAQVVVTLREKAQDLAMICRIDQAKG